MIPWNIPCSIFRQSYLFGFIPGCH